MWQHPISKCTTGNRLSILICTPDSRSARFRRCYDALKDTTLDIPYDLLIFDNRNRPDFSHAREMNKAMRIAEGPLLVLDDDVIVSGDWLRNMLTCLGPGVGAVSCGAAASSGQLRTRGCTFRTDGEAVLWRGNIDGPVMVPATGSFCLLLNLPAWPAGLEFSREYHKYFFDPDLLLRLWEHGLSTITVPDVIIHESGGTMREQGIDRAQIRAHDKEIFRKTWIDTGRLERLYETYSHHWPEPIARGYNAYRRKRQQATETVTQEPRAEIEVVHDCAWRLHVVQQAGIQWILQEMTDHLKAHKPDGVRVTVSDKPVDEPNTLVYWNPYRGMIGTQLLQHARSVAFSTHPEQPEAFWDTPERVDHVVVMAEQYERAYIERGVSPDKVSLIYPGVDDALRDVRLRVFNPCFMSGRPRKGRDVWYALCDTPWLHCICSDGQLSKQEVYAQYRMADVIVSTAVNKQGGEGGPMACEEGLTLGKRTVMPAGIGNVDDFKDNPLLTRYEAGNIDALRAELSPLYHAKVNACMPMAAHTWERWATEMWGVFHGVMARYSVSAR